jgi:hypothetical protein
MAISVKALFLRLKRISDVMGATKMSRISVKEHGFSRALEAL